MVDRDKQVSLWRISFIWILHFPARSRITPLLISSLALKCMYPSKSTLLVCNTGFSVISLVMTLKTSRWRHQRLLKTLWNCFTCSSCEKLWTAPLKWQHSEASQLYRAEHIVLPVNIHLHTSVTLHIYTTRGRHHHSLTAHRACVSLSLPNTLCVYKRPHNLTWPTIFLTLKAICEHLDWISGHALSSPH